MLSSSARDVRVAVIAFIVSPVFRKYRVSVNPKEVSSRESCSVCVLTSLGTTANSFNPAMVCGCEFSPAVGSSPAVDSSPVPMS